MSAAALRLASWIDALSRWVGYIAAWLTLGAALVSALNAIFRYAISPLLALERSLGGAGGVVSAIVAAYGQTANAFSESQWYMFAGAVMLGGAWTLKVNEHVRVDVVYGIASDRVRTWIDLLGHIVFLLPLCAIMVWFTSQWFWISLTSGEMSNSYGGLVRWPVKLALPLGFGLLGLQAFAEIIKCILSLAGRYTRDATYARPVQ